MPCCEKAYEARGGVKDRQQPPSDHGQWMSNRLWLRTTNYLGEMLLLREDLMTLDET